MACDDAPSDGPPQAPPNQGVVQDLQLAQSEVVDLTSPATDQNAHPTNETKPMINEPEGLARKTTRAKFMIKATEAAKPQGRAQPDPEPNESEDESMGTSDPPRYDDAEAEQLSFVEMYEYLKSQLKGLSVEQAKEDESATDFLQQLFASVFESHGDGWLPPARRRYPELDTEETDKMLRLFITDLKDEKADSRKWRARLNSMTRAIYKSRSSLSETIDVLEKSVRAKPGPIANPWSQRLMGPAEEGQDESTKAAAAVSSYKFLRSAYTPEEIADLRELCETRYGYPSVLKKPTQQEEKVIQGLVEGSILSAKFPDFLKRVCSNKGIRRIQNTIRAQVEGDLILQFRPEFKVYPQFQTRKRLTSEFLLGIGNSDNEPAKVIAMLHEAKQICYDSGRHAVHLIFWTRELATKWNNEFKTLLFRNRRFPLRNAHDPATAAPMEEAQ